MTYLLKETILNGAPVNNVDGSITRNVTVITYIQGTPENKFLQTDTIFVTVAGTKTIEEAREQVTTDAQAFIDATYNNQ